MLNLNLTPIDKIAEDLVTAYQQQLQDGDHIASGKLHDTLEYYTKDETGKRQQHYVYHVEWDGKQFILELQMQHYWAALEYGTKPHMPPVSAILKWIKLKKILPRESSPLPMEQQLKSMAWAMAYRIKERGTKPHNVLQDALKASNTVERIKAEIARQIHVDMEQLVVETLSSVKGVGSTGYKTYRGTW